VSDALALAVISLRDAELALADHDEEDASYADIAEAAVLSYRLDGEGEMSCMQSKTMAMGYAILLDPSFVVQLVDELNSDVSLCLDDVLDRKLNAMRCEVEANLECSQGCSVDEFDRSSLLYGIQLAREATHWSWKYFAPDANGSFMSTFRDSSYEECFRRTFATESASPLTDAKLLALVYSMSLLASLKVFKWSGPMMLARFIKLCNPVGILDASIFTRTICGMAQPAFLGYALYTSHYHPNKWYTHRELVIILSRVCNLWMISWMVYLPGTADGFQFEREELIGLVTSALASCVYRIRIERHLLVELFMVPISVIIPSILCERSMHKMLCAMVIKATLSALASTYLWHSEKILRNRFALKFNDKADRME